MTWFKKNWFLVGLLLAIVFLGLVGNRYLSYLELKNLQTVEANMKKIQSDERDYKAKRRNDCLAIYKQESTEWNNTQTWDYNGYLDTCKITYKDPKPKTKTVCEQEYENGLKIWEGDTSNFANDARLELISNNLLCLEGLFQKEF